MALKAPILNVLEKGFFYNWMKENNRLGRQFKVPRLSNDRKVVDSILKNNTLSLNSYKID